jgi:tryptophan-rich sensory protein
MLNKPLAAASAVAAVIAAQLSGASFSPDRDPQTDQWYRNLDKSALTPPGAVFGIAWTILDTLLGYSGYRVMTARSSPSRSAALILWAVTILGVAAHPWTMFRRRRLDEATAVTAGMVAASTGLVTATAAVDRRAAWAALPLMGWVIFAMYLQEEVWRRNPNG